MSAWLAKRRLGGRFGRYYVLCSLLLVLWNAHAYAVAVPEFKAPVTDLAGLLSPTERSVLESKLNTHRSVTGQQFALLVVPSLQGETIEAFSMQVVEKWRLGRDEADDGLLLTVVPSQRKLRIEVGYGLEGELPDAFCSAVIREMIAPAFRRGDYAQGINAGFDLLMARARGATFEEPKRTVREQTSDWTPLVLLLIMPAFVSVLVFNTYHDMRKGNAKRRRRRGGIWDAADGGLIGGGPVGLIETGWSSSAEGSGWAGEWSGSGSGGGGNSSGGGGDSGGGGSFGGGGSSGDW